MNTIQFINRLSLRFIYEDLGVKDGKRWFVAKMVRGKRSLSFTVGCPPHIPIERSAVLKYFAPYAAVYRNAGDYTENSMLSEYVPFSEYQKTHKKLAALLADDDGYSDGNLKILLEYEG